MIICPNCNHQNPEGSIQCESCYTPLPSTSPCPNCGAMVQTDATFCGQCGFNLQANEINIPQTASAADSIFEEEAVPTTLGNDSFQSPWDIAEEEESTEIEGQPFTLDESEMISMSETSLSATDELDEFEELNELGNLGNEELEELEPIEETDDLESWLSSMKEEPSSEENLDFDAEILELETPEFTSASDVETRELETIEFTSAPDVETRELETIEFASSPDVETRELETIEFTSASDVETRELETSEFASSPDAETRELETSEFASASTSAYDNPELLISKPETPSPASVSEFEYDFGDSESSMEEQELETTAQFAASEVTTPETAESSSKSAESPLDADTATRLQLQKAVLFHLQTGTNVEIPFDLAVIHIGKPNNQVPPDVDVSGFANAEIVSRIHADIRVEGDTYFIEDRGSSNGTYINHSPLLTGNRHRLRTGDRISLGKGDLMTFIFQLS